MRSIKDIFRIGPGPSSSHTMAPRKAAAMFLQSQPDAVSYRVTLYSSLAATGRGHLTDKALAEVFIQHKFDLVWKPDESLPDHPNGMRFEALGNDGQVQERWDVYSLGGGALSDKEAILEMSNHYELTHLTEILSECEASGEALWEFVLRHEGENLWPHLESAWVAMEASIERGLRAEGELPGGLGLNRRAQAFFSKASQLPSNFKDNVLRFAYAHAVSEENAAGSCIVTAPTCGACGVLPSVLRFLKESINCQRSDILRALATAGLVGALVRENASISGAEVGCQGEIGTACAMAAAAATQLYGGSLRQIEYAAEMGIEHHLGLTCDPVQGLVQIPCIERNAHAATRAISCSQFSLLTDGSHKISFDEIVAVMNETGHALPSIYRETAKGGIAEVYRQRNVE